MAAQIPATLGDKVSPRWLWASRHSARLCPLWGSGTFLQEHPPLVQTLVGAPMLLWAAGGSGRRGQQPCGAADATAERCAGSGGPGAPTSLMSSLPSLMFSVAPTTSWWMLSMSASWRTGRMSTPPSLPPPFSTDSNGCSQRAGYTQEPVHPHSTPHYRRELKAQRSFISCPKSHSHPVQDRIGPQCLYPTLSCSWPGNR